MHSSALGAGFGGMTLGGIGGIGGMGGGALLAEELKQQQEIGALLARVAGANA